MTSYRKRKRINLGEDDRGVVTNQTPKQNTFSHFTQSPLGVRDIDGLSHAYEQNDASDRIGNTVYVAGTKSMSGVCNDVRIPIKKTSHSERDQALTQYLDANPEVDELIGHSSGGSVILEVQSNYH